MTEISSSQEFFSELELLLNERKYQEAKARLTRRLASDPLNRDAGLYLLLVTVIIEGPLPHQHEINRLRGLSDLSETGKDVVRRVFLLAFNAAEKEGREKQAWVYQRLLRRLLLNQPLDHSTRPNTPVVLPAGEPPHSRTKKYDLPSSEKKRSVWIPRIRQSVVQWRPTISPQTLLSIAAVTLVTAVIPYFLLRHAPIITQVSATISPAPHILSTRNTVLVEKIAFPRNSGQNAVNRDTLQELVNQQLPILVHAYDTWARKNSNLMGTVLVGLKVDQAGNVAAVENLGSRLTDSAFHSAVLDALRKWKFPNVSLAGSELIIPLLFVPQGIAPDPIVRWERALKLSLDQPKTGLTARAQLIPDKLDKVSANLMPQNFVLLVTAILLWAMSLFLVTEAAKNQLWALGGDGAPDPHSGVDMSQLLSCLFVFLWFTRGLLTHPSHDPLQFVSQLFAHPEQLTPGIFVAVFPPLILGLVKLITTVGAIRAKATKDVEQKNRLWVSLVYMALHGIVAIGAAIFLSYSLL